ncbi:Ku protein [Phenylobacterium sp.]|jgi:DNA end-binding protein Ku|uniref:non-homologous end joining protein Ku n=1 Tax=Phenylobacterium sp. TaxID=1871053 RepID=UPI002E301F95|nr:Ku protein [Phenylobacterium sp.]HEX2559373.1 Ku protein [Phenylobacterium sp.]
MATRPTWQGYLRLSLVSCPVALYTATSRSGDVSFNMLHKETHNRIRMIPTDPETGPVDRSEIVKGYEVEKGRYVVITDEEIKNVRLSTTRTLDIERFVDEAEIDRLYWNDPYFLVPDGEMAVEAFTVIREAMENSGKVALGRLVMHQRERLMALEPRDLGILAYSLRSNREVKNPAEVFDNIPDVKPDKAMVDIATQIIKQQEGPFDPSKFNDRYEDALRALIKEKEKGHTVGTPEKPKEAEVIDLMEALRRSLGQGGGSGGAAKKPAASTSRKAAAEKAADPPKIATSKAKPAAKKAPAKAAAAKKPAAKKAPARKSA